MLKRLRLVLVAAAMGLTGLPAPASAQDAAAGAGSLTGTLVVRWADPKDHDAAPGAVRYRLFRDDGSSIPLAVPDALHLDAVNAFNRRVSVRTAPAAAALGAAPTVVSITPIEGRAVAAAARAPTTKKVLFILLKFKGDSQEPHPPSYFKAAVNPLTANVGLGIPGTVNQFMKETTWNKLLYKADVVGVGGLNPTAWFTLPGTKAAYAGCGFSDVCFDGDKATADAVALASSVGVDASLYDSVSFVFNNDLDCCAWGGGTVIKGKVVGATWMPPWSQDSSVYVHELGHSIGLPHSGWRYYAYDSRWDQMSDGAAAATANCGTYPSANRGGTATTLSCQAAGAGYLASYKLKMGWLPAANVATVSTTGTTTIALGSIGTPLGRLAKMIKICLPGKPCTGSKAHYLTVEAKVRSTFSEKGLPGEGVIIHDFMESRPAIGDGNPCFFNTQSGWAVPIDATPGDWVGPPTCNSGGRAFPNYALHNAQFVPGKSYVNRTYGVTVAVLSRSGSTYSVKVTRTK